MKVYRPGRRIERVTTRSAPGGRFAQREVGEDAAKLDQPMIELKGM